MGSFAQILTTTALVGFAVAGCGTSSGSAASRAARVPSGAITRHADAGSAGANGAGLMAGAPAQGSVPTSTVHRHFLLGYSIEHRPISVREVGNGVVGARVLVIGCIHGNERAGISVARRLTAMRATAGIDLWVLEDLNPDGAAADTRQNAHGVDLNRNFAYGWQAAGWPGDQQYPGPRALSEPESRIAQRLVLSLRPQITIYFHQPLGVVDESGGDPRIERRFAVLSRLPLQRLTRYPGSAVGWENHRLPGSTTFVVELAPGNLTSASTTRLARAVLTLAQDLPSRAAKSTHPRHP